MCVTIRVGGRDRNKLWKSFTSALGSLKDSFACMQLCIYAVHQHLTNMKMSVDNITVM